MTNTEENWDERKRKLKQRFAILTDNDLLFEEEKIDEMIELLQIRLGKSKEECTKLLDH